MVSCDLYFALYVSALLILLNHSPNSFTCFKLFVSVTVDTHFNVKPIGTEYWNNRQKVMEAIYRAAEKNQVQFVTTFYPQPLNK
jgi:hypothetical protein